MHCPCAGHDVLGDERRSALRSVPEMALYHILCFRARAFAHAPLVYLSFDPDTGAEVLIVIRIRLSSLSYCVDSG